VTWWRRLDPRLHLAAAVGWAVFMVVAVAALASAGLAAREAETRARADTERLLAQFANEISDALARELATRRSIVQATAAQIVAASDRGDQTLRASLEALQAQFPEFGWLGVVDAHGRVVAGTGGLREGETVADRSWFRRGLEGPVLDDVHRPTLSGASPRDDARAAPPRSVDLAVPLNPPAGGPVGVLAAQLSWSWIEQLQARLLQSLDTRRQLQLVLAAGDGRVLVGPAAWLGQRLPAPGALSGRGAFLVGEHAERAAHADGPGWTVVVRQDAALALAPAQATRRAVFVSVLLAGLVAAAASVAVTRWLLRRLAALAGQARAVQRGAQRALVVPLGDDEVSRIGATLADLVEHLQQEKLALQTLNAELDARVSERTARIERLADDARRAAVTRERLRLARDLHDTLAHSLMSLLTQIRMVRKLRARLAEDELEAELARAEAVAASGLAEARAAIGQMRHNGVRETGLGAALGELLARFQERSGVATALQVDRDAAGLADERAETVFRIVEEALHNVERHAQARSVSLRLGSATPALGPSGRRLTLELADDGIGFDPDLARPGHYGLRGIEEQAALIGAHLDLHSRPGQGTRVALTFDAWPAPAGPAAATDEAGPGGGVGAAAPGA
jgi:signal transduction histidine kinase